ncbi:hypothetical protein ACHWQZ_G016218 [Mnemiopsis leidyi]
MTMQTRDNLLKLEGPNSSLGIYLTLAIMSLAAVIAIAGNLLIIVLFLRIKKIARLTPHIFLTNLALCDLILGLKLPIFFLVTLGHKDAWIFSDPTACLVGGVADSFAFRIVVAGMIAVAVDRYLAVLHAVRYPAIMPEKRAFIIVYLIWIYCLFWSLLPVVVGACNGNKSVYKFDYAHNLCVFRPSSNHSLPLYRTYLVFDLLLNFVAPLTVMTVCYLRIALKVLEPKQVGNTLKRMMQNASLSMRKSRSFSDGGDVIGNSTAKDSGIGIMVEGCESVDDFSEGTEDFIELPAITKPRSTVDNPDLPDVNFKPSNSQSKSGSPQSLGNLRSQSVKSPSSRFSTDSPIHAPRSQPTTPSRQRVLPTCPGRRSRNVGAYNPSVSRSASSTPTHKLHHNKYQISGADLRAGLPKSASLSLTQTSATASPTRHAPKRFSLIPQTSRFGSADNHSLTSSKRTMSIGVLTNSVMSQLRRISHASTAFSKMSKYQQKIARTTVIVYLSFFCCFIPYISSQVVLIIYSHIGNDHEVPYSTQIFVFVSVCFVYFNACINVIIYGTMHRNIQKTLKGVFGNN